MGKYQLDAKAQKIVEKFYEKNSMINGNINKKSATQEKIAVLRAKADKKRPKA